MHSVAEAMTWKFVRRGWLWILTATVAIVGMVALRSWGLSLVGRSIEEWARDPEGRCLLFPIGFVASLFAVLPALCESPWGFSHHLYTKPVPTWFLVAWKMFLGMVAAASVCLVSASACNWLIGADFALAGPAAFFATGLAVTVAGAWSLADFRLWKVGTWLAGAVSLIVWFGESYWDGGLWNQPTLGELLVMGVYVAAAFAFAVVSVASDRCGNTRPWPDIQRIYNRLVGLLPKRRRDFPSAPAAQFWAEWHSRGLVVPGIAAAFIAIPTIILLVGQVQADDAFEAMLGGTLFLGALFSGIFVGAFVGNRQGRKDNFSTFMATRPLSDSQLAFVVLRAAATSAMVVWLVLATGAFVSILGSAALGHHSGALEALRQQLSAMPVWVPPLAVAGSLWLSYATCTWTATLMLTGRQWLLATMNLVFWGGVITVFVLGKFGIVPKSALPFVHLLISCGGIVLMLATAYAFVAARRRRFIGQRTTVSAISVCLVSCIVVAVASWSLVPVSVIVLTCGIIALSVAPVAAAPLALAWNRHR